MSTDASHAVQPFIPSRHQDISARAFWALPQRERGELFSVLRRDDPVSWHRPPELTLTEQTEGYWAVVRHADVRYVSRHPELFCSSQGAGFDGPPPEAAELVTAFLEMDAPRHSKLRGLVTHAFTPRQVVKTRDQIAAQARQIVADAVEARELDVVEDVAMRLPLWTISEMVGVPPADRDEMRHAADVLVSTADVEFVHEGDDPVAAFMGAVMTLHGLAHKMQEERRVTPHDDLMTSLMQAVVDGEALTAQEIASFFVLLAVAGNDTTRNTTALGIKAFSDFPDQWDLLRSNPDKYLDSAVEEIIRWASAVIMFRRTATQDTELAGRSIKKGQRVLMVYESANRDEAVFEDPWRFDITRRPNEHLGFGGGGAHFCLGAPIARTQLRAVFGEFAKSVSRFEAGEIDMITSLLIHNVRRLPCTLHLDT
jgi:cytochrome P450